MSVIKMTDLDLAGKRVFIRADLNVPVKDGKVTSDARIRATIPTLKLALEKGAKVMVTSHLGRPTEGEFTPEDSLQPVVDYLKNAGFNVRLEQDYLNGVDVKDGEIVVLENVRINKGEKKNDPELGKKICRTLRCICNGCLWYSAPRASINLRRCRICTDRLCRPIISR